MLETSAENSGDTLNLPDSPLTPIFYQDLCVTVGSFLISLDLTSLICPVP